MAQIIDFQKHLLKHSIKKELVNDEVEFEIALTTAKYIHGYMHEELDDPLDVITFHASTKELFKGDKHRFACALLEIFGYWNIDIAQEPFNLFDQEFELFPTVETICSFIEKRVV